MRTAVMVLLALVMAVMVLVSIFVVTDTLWSDGEEEVSDTGGFFTECINEVMTDQQTECGLFGEDDEENGG